jgi:Zn-finger nucleic acid-binding protein
MDTAALNLLTHQLIHVLNDSLPKITGVWWDALVIDKLTYQQQSLARQNNLNSLK